MIIKNKSSQNIVSITVGQFLLLIINFFSVTFTARYLGVNGYGIYNFLLTVIIIFSKLTDLGLSNIIFRETSVAKYNYNYVNNGLTIRLLTFLINLLLINLTSIILKFDFERVLILNIFFLSTIFSAKFTILRDLFDIPFKVNLDMFFSNVFQILDGILFLALILLMPLFNGGVSYVVFANLVSNLPGFFIMIIFLRKKYKFVFKPSLNFAKKLIKQSLPLAGYTIFLSIFYQIDIFLLATIDSEKATGLYAVASRIITPLTILPTALSITFFPTISNNFYNQKDNSKIYNSLNKILFFIGTTISLIFTFKANEIINLIFGNEYSQSYLCSIYLIWSCVFLFISFVSLDFFTAAGKQKFNFIYIIVILLTTICLLFFLIPNYSYNGAGFTKLIVSLIGSLFILMNIKKLSIRVNFINKNVISSILIIALVIYFLSFLPLLFYLVLTPILSLIIVLKLHYFQNEELYSILIKFNLEKFYEKLVKWSMLQ